MLITSDHYHLVAKNVIQNVIIQQYFFKALKLVIINLLQSLIKERTGVFSKYCVAKQLPLPPSGMKML